MGWLRHSSRGVQRRRTSRASSRSACPFRGGPLVTSSLCPGEVYSHRRAQPCGTTSALVRGIHAGGHHHLPTSLRFTVVTRFPATTDALTPTGPFVVAGRGSLIHVSLIPYHAVSNHLRFSAGHVPLPQRRPHSFVRAARPFARRLAKTADRLEFSCGGSTATALQPGGFPPDALHPGV